jgi:hypothetical protein
VKFYLGTHEPRWLTRLEVPLFVSRTRLGRLGVSGKPGKSPWAMDSGGFTEVVQYGGWRQTAEEYADEVKDRIDRVGVMPDFVAPQDWMCEDVALKATGLTLVEHQRLTVENFLTLRDLLDGYPVIPVLQGQSLADYLRCMEMYDSHGVDLATERLVGLGSVCRRQGTLETESIIRYLDLYGLSMHGFGVKVSGLRRYHDVLVSADSMAWCRAAAWETKHTGKPAMPGCTHKVCNNCIKYAVHWRSEILNSLT